METFISALWFTSIAYILFLFGKWYHHKYLKQDVDPFFYFLSLRNKSDESYIRLMAPSNDFDIVITIVEDDNILFTKEVILKKGINRIHINTIPNSDKETKIRIKSGSQLIERAFVEVEN